jgi:uncharacterized protein YbjT (DUF2867 family)
MVKKIFKLLGGFFLVLVLGIVGLLLSMGATIPDGRLELRPMAEEAIAMNDDGYLLFGATRNTGLEVAKILRARGDQVTAFVRESSDRTELEKIGVTFVVGDGMELGTVRAAFEGGRYRAALTTIGCLSCDPPPDFLANKNVVDAAVDSGVDRVLLVTTIGAGDSINAIPWLSKRVLAKTLPMKTEAEEYIRASGLDYTIVRPGGLRSDRETGQGIVSEDLTTFGFIFRKDLAGILVACLDDPATIGKTLAAVDANRQWPWSNE